MSVNDARIRQVLVVEDEPALAALVADYLRAEGWQVSVLTDGREVIPWLRANAVDLILLDLMLPGQDGLSICRELRSFSTVAVIMVTARVEEIDRLLGLEIGADDYVCKPFSPRELVARARALLRRTHDWRAAEPAGDASEWLVLDEERFSAVAGGLALELTPVEFRLLRTLAQRPGRVFPRAELLRHLYLDHRIVAERTVDSHIKNLRRKLEDACPGCDAIRSIYGVGFRYEPPPD